MSILGYIEVADTMEEAMNRIRQAEKPLSSKKGLCFGMKKLWYICGKLSDYRKLKQ